MDGPGQGAKAATGAMKKGADLMNQALGDLDLPKLRSACQGITDSLTIRLPASLPTPDPDLTNALQFLVDDGTELKSACDELDDPPTDGQLTAVEDAMHQLGADMRTAGTIINREGDLLMSEANRQ